MVKFSDLLVNESLHGLACSNLIASLIFMMSSLTYILARLTIDDVTSFVQLICAQNIRRNRHFSQNKSYKMYDNSNTLFKMEESLMNLKVRS